METHDESLNFIASASYFPLELEASNHAFKLCDLISTGMLKYPERDLALTRPPPGSPTYNCNPTAEAQYTACAPWATIIKSALDTFAAEQTEKIVGAEENDQNSNMAYEVKEIILELPHMLVTTFIFLALKKS